MTPDARADLELIYKDLSGLSGLLRAGASGPPCTHTSSGVPLSAFLRPPEPAKRTRRRPVTLASALRQAKRAGVAVKGAVLEPGKVTLQFGQTDGSTNDTPDDVERWISEHARH
jgi:hypothetical protein